MQDFIETFSLIIISVFCINLISGIYPSTKNKHTLMVVFSVITVYICVSPIGALLSKLGESREVLSVGASADFETDAYELELINAVTAQVNSEINGYFQRAGYDDLSAEVYIAAEETGDDDGERRELEINRVVITCKGEVTAIREAEVREYISENYAVEAEFRGVGDNKEYSQ